MTFKIKPAFTAKVVPAYFDYQNNFNCEVLPITSFETRKNFDFSIPKELMICVPEGTILTGGFARSIINNEPIKNLDLFFDDSDTFCKLVKRIQNAPVDSFLHNYTAVKSLNAFNASSDKSIIFTHPTRPPLQLMRDRWYNEIKRKLYNSDFTVSMFAMDYTMNIHYTSTALADVTAKVIRVNMINFEQSSSLRAGRLLEQKYVFSNSNNMNHSQFNNFISRHKNNTGYSEIF